MEVLLWAKRICATRGAPAHQMLEIPADATAEVAQQAFHNIARKAHPDLHRTTATPDELELVTAAFSAIAAAYQQFRSRMTTTRIAPLRPEDTLPRGAARPAAEPTAETGEPLTAAASAGQQMSSRALVHYRKAEQSLRRGDLPQATLHLKMAIASDPSSTFLRTALREVQSEVVKKP